MDRSARRRDAGRPARTVRAITAEGAVDYGLAGLGATYPSIYNPASRILLAFESLVARTVPTKYVRDEHGRAATLSIDSVTYFHPTIKDIPAEKA
ncbi:hypothetical protein GCM10018777_11460 [Streptomyces albogriseolus]|uniref:hypothetical protein n=1 Tax=Streptomyces albogriseolus TaxID=1887 RepID=UPI001677F0C0|nr:hypothetical protein [Streptomyces viridodiastaticus]MCX4570619.1 hypothetical protein [Streptomyces viridodiastaticus]GHG02334.1 hypothetical protein GCM10018777_11460 [Streptomyces viridodiastaticus]